MTPSIFLFYKKLGEYYYLEEFIMIGIYKITNQLNNKVYIGQSNDIERRWKDHKRRSKSLQTPLYLAIQQDGIENFHFEVLEECSVDSLNEREKYWIDYYNSADSNYGYNLLKYSGYNRSDNLRQKHNYTSLTEEQVNEIKEKLKDNSHSILELSRKYNCSDMAIHYINTGTSWYDSNISYPIRDTPYKVEATKRFCINCGKQISPNAERCVSCSHKFAQTVNRPTREELKKVIRVKSFTQIGKIFGVSDNAIRKWCDSYGLPRKKSEIKKYTDEEWEVL